MLFYQLYFVINYLHQRNYFRLAEKYCIYSLNMWKPPPKFSIPLPYPQSGTTLHDNTRIVFYVGLFLGLKQKLKSYFAHSNHLKPLQFLVEWLMIFQDHLGMGWG